MSPHLGSRPFCHGEQRTSTGNVLPAHCSGCPCKASEGSGDRVPGAWGGMWGRRWVESLEMRDGKYLYQNKFTLKFTFSLQICLILVSLFILFYIFNFLFYLGLCPSRLHHPQGSSCPGRNPLTPSADTSSEGKPCQTHKGQKCQHQELGRRGHLHFISRLAA